MRPDEEDDMHDSRRVGQRPGAHSAPRTAVWRAPVLAVVMTAALGTRVVAADAGGGPESVFAAARTALENGEVEQTRMLGFSVVTTAFREVPPEGAVLVGFELGLGKWRRDQEAIFALRPIYQTAQGETVSPGFGPFVDRRGPTKTAPRGKVLRTTRVRARPGYAVAGITVRSGVCIYGLQVRFQRLNGRTLDARNEYRSEWVGDRQGGREESVGGGGAPVVGVFGNQNEHHVLALGLIHLRLPHPEPQQAPAPPPEPADTAPPLPPPEPEEAPAKAAEAADPPPANDQPGNEQPPPAAGMSWLPFAVFGPVAIPVFLILLGSAGRKRPASDDRQAGTDPLAGMAPTLAPSAPPGDLGPLCREYTAAGYGQVDVVASLVGIGACVAVGVYLATETAGGLHPLFAGLLLLAVVGLLFYLRHGIRNVRRRVRLFTDGFAYQDGDQVTAARWEDVKSLKGLEPVTINGRPSNLDPPLHIVLRDGRRFTLPFSIKGLEECATLLYERCGKALGPNLGSARWGR
jgi:hypothetical protein